MLPNVVPMIVVYFDQRLGAVHSKHWYKYAFSMYFFAKKPEKAINSVFSDVFLDFGRKIT